MSEYQALLMNEYAKQYATSWFKMDEGSGNIVYDSKGNVTGTTSANATWTNNELIFNSTYRVLFSNPIFTRGSKTLVFDIKTTQNVTTYPHILRTTSTNASGGNGFWLMLSEGKLIFVFQNSSTTKYFSPNKIISDGISHRVKFIQNGVDSTAKIKIYVDDVLLVNTTFGMTEPSYTNNMRLSGGSDVTMTDSFNGVIKNIIYFKDDIDTLKLNKSLILHDGEYKKYINRERKIIYTSDIIPTMSANTNGNVTVSASSISTGYEAWKAFNDINNNFDSWTTAGNKAVGEWIRIDFGENKRVAKYTVSDRGATVQLPTAWRFQGSTDNTTWITLDTQKNQISPSSYFVMEYEIKEELIGDYRYYRILVDGAGYAYIGFSEIQMMEIERIDEEMKDFSIVSTTLPTQEQFLIGGMDSLTPLLDRRVETLEPLPMTDKSEILQVGEVGKVFSKTLDLKKYMDIRSMKVEVE